MLSYVPRKRIFDLDNSSWRNLQSNVAKITSGFKTDDSHRATGRMGQKTIMTS